MHFVPTWVNTEDEFLKEATKAYWLATYYVAFLGARSRRESYCDFVS